MVLTDIIYVKGVPGLFKIIGRTTAGVAAANSSSEALRAYMREMVPNHDDARLHDSHNKKLLRWYNILKNRAAFGAVGGEQKE